MARFVRIALMSAAFMLPLFVACTCNNDGNPSAAGDGQYGTLEIRTRMANGSLAKSSSSLATAAPDSLVVVIGDKRIAQRMDFTRPTATATFAGIPAGTNLDVEIFAVAADGTLTHIDTLEYRQVTIVAGQSALVQATLIPAAGSIYLHFLNLPSNSSVYASFVSNDDTFDVNATANRTSSSNRVSLSLDNIPHDAEGTLTVIIYDAANATGDTLRIISRTLKFDARGDNAIDWDNDGGGNDGDDGNDGGEDNGSLELDVNLYAPGVGVFSYDFNRPETGSAVEESGELIITEIMWNITYENYIELYNTQNETLEFDTLIIEVNTGNFVINRFFDVSIDPLSYRVFGRQDASYVDYYTPTSSGLAIGSSGNWITVKRKDGTVIDRVICATGTSNSAGNTGWPGMTSSARQSIQLHPDKYNAIDNNYGKNWFITAVADSNLIDGTENYGTPGR